jgi:hypothetical protein
VPFAEANKALVLLSTQALTTGTEVVVATAKPPTVVAPITNPIKTLTTELFISLLGFIYGRRLGI